jgi:hypothetical protein
MRLMGVSKSPWVWLPAAVAILTSSCTGHSSPAKAEPSASPSVTPSPALSSPSSPTVAQGSNCHPTGSGVPAGALCKVTLDIDGDGRRDFLWILGNGPKATAGITTASGVTRTVSQDFAGGIAPQALVADVDERGTIVMIFGNNRSQSLYRWLASTLEPVTNPQGSQYGFDAGIVGTGTGVGCSKVHGAAHRDLVSLLAESHGPGKPFRIKRTQVVIQGHIARNGLVDYVSAADGSAAAASAYAITCGKLRMERDGVVLQ